MRRRAAVRATAILLLGACAADPAPAARPDVVWEGPVDPLAVSDATFAAGTATYQLETTTVFQGLGIEITGTGSADFVAGRSADHLTLDESRVGNAPLPDRFIAELVDFRTVVDGDAMYVCSNELPAIAAVGCGRVPLAMGTVTLLTAAGRAPGPLEALELLEAATVVEDLGRDELPDGPARRVRAELLSDDAAELAGGFAMGPGETIDLDVWVDGQGRLVRFRSSLTFQGNLLEPDDQVRMVAELHIVELGVPVEIVVPDEAVQIDVITDLLYG